MIIEWVKEEGAGQDGVAAASLADPFPVSQGCKVVPLPGTVQNNNVANLLLPVTEVNATDRTAMLCSLHFFTVGTGTSSAIVEQSNDGVLWVACPSYDGAAIAPVFATNFTYTANSVREFAPSCRYIRVRVNTAGTGGAAPTGALVMAPTGSPRANYSTVQPNAAASTAADAVAGVSTAGQIASPGYAWNGATWDRLRSATAASVSLGRLLVSPGQPVSTLLNAVTANTTGASVDLGVAVRNHALQIINSNGLTGSVTLQGSLNNLNWQAILTHSIGTDPNDGIKWADGMPVRYVRAVLAGFTGTSPTMTALYTGSA